MLRLPLSHPVACIDVIMNGFQFGSNSPKSFQAYPNKGDFDLESGTIRKPRKPKRSAVSCPMTMVKSLGKRLHYYYELHPLLVFFVSFTFGVTILVLLSLYESRYRTQFNYRNIDIISDDNPFAKLKNLVMVAGHSVYTSSSCEKADKDDSWFLEPYQKHPGQASTFLEHIQDGVEVAAIDEEALLLFSGGETRRDAGPRSEAQSYWAVAESKGWFGKQDNVRWRALTEEHARDSFENLLFSVCRFRELTGIYPHNITVISYDFKEERFGNLHRDAIRFPEGRFFFSGTPVSSTSKVAATKGEALVRAQFQQDPYGCLGSLRRKKIGRDPFHRSIPYPSGCPEIEGLFRYCGPVPYSGSLPW